MNQIFKFNSKYIHYIFKMFKKSQVYNIFIFIKQLYLNNPKNYF